MDWTVDGHQLRLLSALPGHQTSDVYDGERVQATADARGFSLLMPWHRRVCSIADVAAFVVVCDCTLDPAPPPPRIRFTRTQLARWQRVDDPHLDDLDADLVYLPADQNATALHERADVQAHLLALWGQHRAPQEAVAAIEAAWAHSRRALTALEEAVTEGREAGLSWADIGRATAMTRQSARERWTRLDQATGAAPTPRPTTRRASRQPAR